MNQNLLVGQLAGMKVCRDDLQKHVNNEPVLSNEELRAAVKEAISNATPPNAEDEFGISREAYINESAQDVLSQYVSMMEISLPFGAAHALEVLNKTLLRVELNVKEVNEPVVAWFIKVREVLFPHLLT